MRRNRSNKAFTLIEIIIASTVVAVILMGIVTSSISLQRSSKNSSNSYFVAQTTQTFLNQILLDAYKAVGNIGSPGIRIGTVDPNTTCFYQQNVGVPLVEFLVSGLPSIITNPVPQPPQWACYTYPLITDATGGDLFACRKPVTSTGPLYGAGACTTGSLGKIKSAEMSFVTLDTQGGTQKVIFHAEIKNCLKVTGVGVTCGAGDSDNPYVVKEGSASPPAHSASPNP
jgi:prepilin-type N-terminal cleavage/methylation domain-containing protein